MFPVWFFIILISVICYLLYITRPSEETLIVMSKNRIRKMQFWLKSRYKWESGNQRNTALDAPLDV